MTYALTHYVDVVIRPDPEFAAHQVLNALYVKLHRALHDLSQNGISLIGVSFPKQKTTNSLLGDTLRLHGSEQQLQALMALPWRNGMHDHVQCSAIEAVPTACTQYRTIRRVNMQGNPEKLRRRWLKRHPNEDPGKALAHYPSNATARSRLPFLSLQSRSNGQRYTLFIRQDASGMPGSSPKFNTFGLSVDGGAVPWF